MAKNKETILVDCEEDEKIPAWQLIRRKPASKRSSVNSYQVTLFVKLANKFEGAVLNLYNIADPENIQLDRFQEIFNLDEYHLLIDAFFACGFVCRDFNLECNLDAVNDRPDEAIRSMDFPAIRHYLHVLQRGEKWADGYSSPILAAIKSGALIKVADRLESDDSLYENF
jgi:hypothetical protein